MTESEADQTEEPAVHGTVMDATYRALCAEGYADLTMQDIADEAGKSKSLLHYHYDTKDELLVTFLAHLLDRFDEKVSTLEAETATPAERFEALVDKLLPGDEEWVRFHRALFELRTQAPYDAAFREQLLRNRTFLVDLVADIVRDGIEAGDFRDVDPEMTARLVVSALDGTRSARVTLGDEADPPAIRAGLVRYVLDDLRTEGDEQ